MYEVFPHKKVVKYYENLDDRTAERINKGIDKISSNPFESTRIKKLKGKLEGKYRYNLGDLRIVYSVDKEKKSIFIEAIGPRGDVYK